MPDPLEEEVKREIDRNKILIYAKGTKDTPKCGFTAETMEFFNKYAVPYEVIDVLENTPKREYLSKMTNWPTLPKVFIDGKFYGDTDILGPMEEKGELQSLLKSVFQDKETRAR